MTRPSRENHSYPPLNELFTKEPTQRISYKRAPPLLCLGRAITRTGSVRTRRGRSVARRRPPITGRQLMSDPIPAPVPLYKQRSWSPDTDRDEAWLRRKNNSKRHRKQSRSLTDEDLEELKACIELGFGFGPDSPILDQRLSDTLPALGLYYAVQKMSISKSSSEPSIPAAAANLEASPSSPTTIMSPGDTPQVVKTKLRQWAQVVACSVRQSLLV